MALHTILSFPLLFLISFKNDDQNSFINGTMAENASTEFLTSESYAPSTSTMHSIYNSHDYGYRTIIKEPNSRIDSNQITKRSTTKNIDHNQLFISKERKQISEHDYLEDLSNDDLDHIVNTVDRMMQSKKEEVHFTKSFRDEVTDAMEIKAMADGLEERLYKLLFNQGYEKDIRPTAHHTIVTNITFGFLLNQIVELDEKNQILTTRSWLNLNWIDSRLKWNVSEWSGIKIMYAPYQKLWKPDVILVNNAVRQYSDAIVSTDIMVTSDGNVTWLYSAIFKSSCQIRVRYYPFDDQECELKFASWSHELSEMDLQLITDKGDLSSYMNNSEFDLLEMTATRVITSFPTHPSKHWPVIIIRIRMHRRPLFYVFNHILPCVLISSMALLGFFMPPETGEKITMCITTILSMGVYLQSITESIPPTSEAVPLIGMYYVMSLFMVCLATFVNVITLNVHRGGIIHQGRGIPLWMKKYILGYMASIVGVSIKKNSITTNALNLDRRLLERCGTFRESKEDKFQGRSMRKYGRHDDDNNFQYGQDMFAHQKKIETRFLETHTKNNYSFSVLPDSSSITYFDQLKDEVIPRLINRRSDSAEFEERTRTLLRRLNKSLEQYETREKLKDEKKKIMWQWRQLATVIDRFLLFIFLFATIFTVAFFLVIPATYRDRAAI